MRHILVALAFLFGVGASAQDRQWVLLAKGTLLGERGATETYVDTTSLVCDGTICRAFQRQVFSAPRHVDGTPLLDEMVTLQEFDCDARTIRTLNYTMYLQGKEVDRSAEESSFRRVVARSIGDVFMTALCHRFGPD